MSIPVCWNNAGLAIGVHFLGRYGDEATLLKLAVQLESARSWADGRPPGINQREPRRPAVVSLPRVDFELILLG